MRIVPLALAAALSSTIAAAAAPPSPSRSPLAMDIAGVRLGMTFEEAQAAVSPSYRCKRFGSAPTFAELVKDEVDKRHNAYAFGSGRSAVSELDCVGPASETLQIIFRAAPSGMLVDTMNFAADASHVVIADMAAQVASKYGRPSEGTAVHGRWCASKCAEMRPARFVTMIGGNGAQIFAYRGDDAEAIDDAAVQAAADRIAPKSAKAAF